MKMNRIFAAIALAFAALAPATGMADTIAGRPISSGTGVLPSIAIYCDDGTGRSTICTFTGGGGGSSGGTATSAAPTYSNGAINQPLSLDLNGNLRVVQGSLPTGTNKIGGVTIADGDSATLGAKADSAYSGSGSASLIALQKGLYSQLATLNGYPTGNATARLLSSAATTNATLVKNSAGSVVSIQGYNAKTSAVFLKLYNKASAPTVGTDTPSKTLYVPASSAFAFDFPTGVYFGTGIAFALTGAVNDNDTTAIAAGDVLALNVDYN